MTVVIRAREIGVVRPALKAPPAVGIGIAENGGSSK